MLNNTILEQDRERTQPFHGWLTKDTYDVAVWATNTLGVYRTLQKSKSYLDFVERMKRKGIVETTDNVSLTSPYLSILELDELVQQSKEHVI